MIKNNYEYYSEKFADINLDNITIEGTTFDNCSFNHCSFNKSILNKNKFIDCTFKSTSMNLIKLYDSSFIDTEFKDCKMQGINWTQIAFPFVIVTSPIFFNNCDISYSSFYELKLPSISITNCKSHEVDFRLADLSSADFSGSDLENSQFNNTNLNSSDLRGAVNYRIDPADNKISKSLFSLPDVLNLLSSFNIKIDGID